MTEIPPIEYELSCNLTKKELEFQEMLYRLFVAADCEDESELALILDIDLDSVTASLKEKVIPQSWLSTLYAKKRINPEWVRTGRGSKLLLTDEECKDRLVNYIIAIKRKQTVECSTEELFIEIVRRALQKLE